MPIQPIDQTLIFVFFIYGLAFFGMGLTLALEVERYPALTEARLLRPLAAFGMIHGTHEWLEAYLMQSEWGNLTLPDWLPWVRLGLLAASFCSLVIYGIITLLHRPLLSKIEIVLGLSVLGLFVLGILVSAALTYNEKIFSRIDILDNLTRYLLAVPGGVLAAMALRAEALDASRAGRKPVAMFLTWASVGFGLYGLSQIFVHGIDMFPARILNTDSFRLVTGFPIQIVRTMAAVVITICILRATQLMEKERRQQLLATQNERLAALERVQEELAKRAVLRRELLRHTVRAQEDERARIARELHDETSQILTAFSLDLATLDRTVSNRPDAKLLVDRLQSLSRQMSQGLYRLVSDLRPAQLDDLGLIPALEYLKETCFSKGLDVSVAIEGKAHRLDPIIETVLFRLAQEALANTIRHAHTEKATLFMTFQPDEVILCVSDGGIGFDPVESFVPPRGWGLAGMRERVESVGGELRIDSAPGKGTLVEVMIPLDSVPIEG